MLDKRIDLLKEEVFEANMELVKQGLVIYTWGNVSAIDRESGLVVIKPSGVSYEEMSAGDMVVLDLDGNIVQGTKRPSSDTKTHLVLYKAFDTIQSVVHTHSEWATCWAQAGTGIPCYGTTHADYFYGQVICTRELTDIEIEQDYEYNTGLVMIETLQQNNLNPLELPGMLVSNHGPFSWGTTPKDAVHNAKVLDEVAKMAYRTEIISNRIKPIKETLLNKHYLRKHGKNAYYGQ
ncbi:L-ribulose-5-phosphate 4-epimerase [Vallitalea okinawensis]|uniref:L-ribulose-5-phosphate 4-epimerase n=1 Tax=Vallitalea okinawensis TaxID=2078660 RepID=UPI000CFDA1D2|nr:L-ribulose-5-phosphate 4-epimerase [Vallitalea okinawensis]